MRWRGWRRRPAAQTPTSGWRRWLRCGRWWRSWRRCRSTTPGPRGGPGRTSPAGWGSASRRCTRSTPAAGCSGRGGSQGCSSGSRNPPAGWSHSPRRRPTVCGTATSALSICCLASCGTATAGPRGCCERTALTWRLPGRSDAELLRGLGIDLAAVRRQAEDTFGGEGVGAATWRVMRRPWWRGGAVGWTPLCGKALAAKGALHLAGVEADALGRHEVGPEQVLLGVLRDAAALRGDPRPSRRARRTRAYLGLPGPGASPVGRVVQGCGLTLEQLRAAVLAQLHAAT